MFHRCKRSAFRLLGHAPPAAPLLVFCVAATAALADITTLDREKKSSSGNGISAATAHTNHLETASLYRAFVRLKSYGWDKSREELQPIEDAVLAAQPGSAPARELETRLCSVLASSAPRAAKDYVCRQLALVGTSNSVPALAALLPNPELTHMARFALERVPDPSANAALRQGLGQARGEILVGIINSLGALKDENSTGVLTGLLTSQDIATARAAATALGRIGTTDAAAILEDFYASAPVEIKSAAGNAWLAAAQNLARGGRMVEAARILRSLNSDETPVPLRLPAFQGLVSAEPDRAIGLLSGALAGDNESLRALASRMIAEQPREQPLKPLLELRHSLPVPGQVALLGAIRLRRNPAARAAVLNACDSAEAPVRLAALEALAVVGSADDVPRLLRLAAGQGEESATARLALATLPGRQPSEIMLVLFPDAQPQLQIELLKALAARSATQAAPMLADQLGAPNEPVRRAALEALAVLGNEHQAPAVIAFLNNAAIESDQRMATSALEALVTRAESRILPALLAGYKSAPPHSQVVLLQQFSRLGGSQALALTRAAIQHENMAVRDAAFRAYFGWPDVEALPHLMRTAETETDPGRRTLALRGVVRLCSESQLSPAERLEWLKKPAKLASSTQDKTLIIAALAETPNAGSLELLSDYLKENSLEEAARLAMIKVVSAVGPEHKQHAVAALHDIVKTCQNPEAQEQAKTLLKKFNQ
jgi:HEAT repeat protein